MRFSLGCRRPSASAASQRAGVPGPGRRPSRKACRRSSSSSAAGTGMSSPESARSRLPPGAGADAARLVRRLRRVDGIAVGRGACRRRPAPALQHARRATSGFFFSLPCASSCARIGRRARPGRVGVQAQTSQKWLRNEPPKRRVEEAADRLACTPAPTSTASSSSRRSSPSSRRRRWTWRRTCCSGRR